MKPLTHLDGFAWTWSRYRHRLFARYQDPSRDFNEYRTACFVHRCLTSICHCTDDAQHRRITPKTAIPPRKDHKAWAALLVRLDTFGDYPEHNTRAARLPLAQLSERERLLATLVGVKPRLYASQ